MDGYEYSHCICMVCYKHWNHEIESADNTKAASTTTTIYTGKKKQVVC